MSKHCPNCGIQEEKVHTQKELRIIQDLEPVMNTHRLVVNKSILEDELKELERDDKNLVKLLFYQLTRITKDRGCLKHDDRLDALAGAVRYWMNSMSRDSEEAAEDWEVEMLERYKDNFIEQVTGFSGLSQATHKSDNWLDNL